MPPSPPCPLVPIAERRAFLEGSALSPGMVRLLLGAVPRRLLWGAPGRMADAVERWDRFPSLFARRWCPLCFDLGMGWVVDAAGRFARFDREDGLSSPVDERAFFRVAVVENGLGPLDEAEELEHWRHPDRITDPELREVVQELAGLGLPYFGEVMGEVWPTSG